MFNSPDFYGGGRALDRTTDLTRRSVVEELVAGPAHFVDAAAYAFQQPIIGTAEFVGGKDLARRLQVIARPEQSKNFWSIAGISQALGTAVGMAPSFTLLSKGVYATLRTGGLGEATLGGVAASALSGTVSGAIYEGALMPTEAGISRMQRATVGAVTFGVLGACERIAVPALAGMRFNSMVAKARAEGVKGAIGGSMAQLGFDSAATKTVAGVLAGIPAGIANVQAESLATRGEPASVADSLRGASQFAFVGGALSMGDWMVGATRRSYSQVPARDQYPLDGGAVGQPSLKTTEKAPLDRLSPERRSEIQWLKRAPELKADTISELEKAFPGEELQDVGQLKEFTRTGRIDVLESRDIDNSLLTATLTEHYSDFDLLAYLVTPQAQRGKGYASSHLKHMIDQHMAKTPDRPILVEIGNTIGMPENSQAVKRARMYQRVPGVRFVDAEAELGLFPTTQDASQPVSERGDRIKSHWLLIGPPVTGSGLRGIVRDLYKSGYSISESDPFIDEVTSRIDANKTF